MQFFSSFSWGPRDGLSARIERPKCNTVYNYRINSISSGSRTRFRSSRSTLLVQWWFVHVTYHESDMCTFRR